MSDLAKVITNLRGIGIKAGDGDLTVEEVCLDALMSNAEGLDGATKAARYEIALKILGKSALTADETATLKKCIGDAFPPLIVGQAWRVLDGKDTGIGQKP